MDAESEPLKKKLLSFEGSEEFAVAFLNDARTRNVSLFLQPMARWSYSSTRYHRVASYANMHLQWGSVVQRASHVLCRGLGRFVQLENAFIDRGKLPFLYRRPQPF